ncbi:portal protein [Candidatus Enterovibrio escicola]|uniref:portal protein n=1 Tax=Candidatus Enterovibrio escicola TaxID=1927127 RepID=UPI001237C205|nr:portal protein [Candidatus Enterovibrio escacola]
MKIDNIANLFLRLSAEWKPYLSRDRLCASLTIPSLLPKAVENNTTNFKFPHDGFGVRAIKQLAAKLLLVFFPPNRTFMRITIDPKHSHNFGVNTEGKGQLDITLAQTEKLVWRSIEQ